MRLKERYLNEFDIKTLVGHVLLQVGMTYEDIAFYFIGLDPVVSLTSAVALKIGPVFTKNSRKI